jgi:hypothetical protein
MQQTVWCVFIVLAYLVEYSIGESSVKSVPRIVSPALRRIGNPVSRHFGIRTQPPLGQGNKEQPPQSQNGHLPSVSWLWASVAALALVPLLHRLVLSWRHNAPTEPSWSTVSLVARRRPSQSPSRKALSRLNAYENFLPDRLDPAVRKYWELEDPIEIDGKMVDLHEWVTLPWDGDWFKDDLEDEDVDPLEPEPESEQEPVSLADLEAEAFFDKRREEEQRLWDEARAEIGLIVPYSMKDDYRIKGHWDEERTLTQEELDELIGPIPEPSPLQVLNPFRTVQHDEGDPNGPGSMIDWMRSEGLLVDEPYSSDEEFMHAEEDENDDPERWLGDDTAKWMAREEAGEDEISGEDDDRYERRPSPEDAERAERGEDDVGEEDLFDEALDEGGYEGGYD